MPLALEHPLQGTAKAGVILDDQEAHPRSLTDAF